MDHESSGCSRNLRVTMRTSSGREVIESAIVCTAVRLACLAGQSDLATSFAAPELLGSKARALVAEHRLAAERVLHLIARCTRRPQTGGRRLERDLLGRLNRLAAHAA